MRALCFAAVICLLCGCAKQNAYDEVWSNYDWLPPDAEYTNPYLIPNNTQPTYPSTYRGPAYPTYDNDADYIQPRSWGMCSGTNNLGGCE